jgi:hypothetical protein
MTALGWGRLNLSFKNGKQGHTSDNPVQMIVSESACILFTHFNCDNITVKSTKQGLTL